MAEHRGQSRTLKVIGRVGLVAMIGVLAGFAGFAAVIGAWSASVIAAAIAAMSVFVLLDRSPEPVDAPLESDLEARLRAVAGEDESQYPPIQPRDAADPWSAN